MPVWQWLLDVLGLLLALVLAYGICLIVRRRLLARNGGTFELSYRVRTARPGRGWLLGIGRYSGETLEWFRIFSLSPRPKRCWQRTKVAYESSRVPEGMEAMALYPGHVVVTCLYDRRVVELAMAPASLTGFQAWLESRPPGTDWSR